MLSTIHLRITWRYLLKNRLSTILNIIGLSTGLACALLIYLWVSDELQMDKFHSKGDRLYHVMENRLRSGGIWSAPSTSGPTAAQFAKDFPEVEYAVTIRDQGDVLLTGNEKNIRSAGKLVSADFFDVFTFPVLAGDARKTLANSNGILISDELANKLFGSVKNAVGQKIDWEHNEHYFVGGVFKTPGEHSSEHFDFVVSIEKLFKAEEWMRGWGSTGARTYLTLKPGSNEADFNNKIAGFIKKITNGEITHRTPFITLYKDEYLYGDYENGVISGGRIDYLKLFSIIAVFIVIIACINFMNLSTAKAANRTKEVGIKKVVGADRRSLILQYLGESLLITAISALVAIGLVYLLLPAFNTITNKQLHFTFDWKLTGAIAGITVATGFIAGSYPALYLSGFKPGIILKGQIRTGFAELFARKGLVVFQFTLSVFLIIAVMVVYRQIEYVQSKNLGFNRNNVVIISKEGKLTDDNTSKTFLSEVRKLPTVVNAANTAHSLTGHNSGTFGVQWPGRDPEDKTEFENISADYGTIKTLGMTVLEGREFSPEYGADSSAIVFNEAAIRYMNLKEPIGKQVTLWGTPRHIIGVVKDFHFESLHKDIGPAFFILNRTSQIAVRIQADKTKEALSEIKAVYSRFNPDFELNYAFLDERFQNMYAAEQRVSVLSRYFAGLAICISCLGLFGLTAFTAQRRQKEISIRKIIGATATIIVLMLSRDFLKLILIAVIIAFPISWWAINQWLDGFAYRIPISGGVFALAAIAILLITALTIGFQSLKAARANPMDNLRTE
jgi:predicted permease